MQLCTWSCTRRTLQRPFRASLEAASTWYGVCVCVWLYVCECVSVCVYHSLVCALIICLFYHSQVRLFGQTRQPLHAAVPYLVSDPPRLRRTADADIDLRFLRRRAASVAIEPVDLVLKKIREAPRELRKRDPRLDIKLSRWLGQGAKGAVYAGKFNGISVDGKDVSNVDVAIKVMQAPVKKDEEVIPRVCCGFRFVFGAYSLTVFCRAVLYE